MRFYCCQQQLNRRLQGRWRQTPSRVHGIILRNWSEGISVIEEEKCFQCDGGQMLE